MIKIGTALFEACEELEREKIFRRQKESTRGEKREK